MAETLCRIIITGHLVPGKNRQTVIRELADLFKCTPEKAAELINGKPMPLKRVFDQESAKRYATRLLKIGVKCGMREIKSQGASEIMVCPKCFTEQATAAECNNCGIVIERYKKTPAQAQPDAAAQQTQSDSLLLQLAGGVNRDYYRKKFARFEAKDEKYALQWNLHAFLIPFAWFIYRKMPVAAAAVWLMYAILPRTVLIGVHLLCGFGANYWYFRSLQLKVEHLPRATDQARARAISRGGVAQRPVMVAAAMAYFVIALYVAWPFASVIGLISSDIQELNEKKVEKLQQEREADLANAADTALKVISESVRGRIYEYEAKGKSIGIPETREQLIQHYEIDEKIFQDAWDRPVMYRKYARGFILTSAGSDGVFGNTDDVRLEVEVRLSRPVAPPPGMRPTVRPVPGGVRGGTAIDRNSLEIPPTEENSPDNRQPARPFPGNRSQPLLPAD